MLTPLKNELRNYSYCTNRLNNDIYRVKKSVYPEEWKRTLSPPHSHDFPQVWYCLRGCFALVFGEETIKIEQGQVFVVPIGAPHQFMIEKDQVAEIFCLDIRYDVLKDTEPAKYLNAKKNLFMHCFSKELRSSPQKPVSLCPASKKSFHEKLSQLSVNSLLPVSMQETHLLLEDIFSLPEFADEKVKKERIERIWREKVTPLITVIKYINENYSEKILVDDLLRLSVMGHTAFCSTFKKFIGCPFLAYLQQIRLLHCHIFFGTTTYSMAYIATLCGFSNQSHMERAYKKHSGVLPKRARNHSLEWRKYISETKKI